ncbi:MAG TPA: ABC transporter substrate-binding protein [Thermoleophilaceae bacterium]|jgi:NitT/TauT family transport system substrate-binding protein
MPEVVRRDRSIALTLLAALVCAVFVAACGSSSTTKKGEPATLKVGVISIADVAPLYLGMKKGFFKEQKLTIQPKPAEGGAAIVASVVSGDDQIGFSNTTSLLIANTKNVPVKLIAQGVIGAQKPTPDQAWDAVLVKKNSSIKTAKDLEGKTISVNTLQNVGPLTINTALKKAGADYKKVKYSEIPFPDALGALDQGRIDAAWEVEPFVSQAKSQGDRVVLYPYEQTTPKLTVASYLTTKQYADQNSDVVDRFVKAINKSLTYAQSHPAEVRKIVPTYTKIPAGAAKTMNLPLWSSDIGRPTIELQNKLSQDYGFQKKQADLDDLIRPQK